MHIKYSFSLKSNQCFALHISERENLTKANTASSHNEKNNTNRKRKVRCTVSSYMEVSAGQGPVGIRASEEPASSKSVYVQHHVKFKKDTI